MSRFEGRQGKGAMRQHREWKRLEAEERQAAFEAEVARVSDEENVPHRLAYQKVMSRRRIARQWPGLAS
jgi:hypothetical protein